MMLPRHCLALEGRFAAGPRQGETPLLGMNDPCQRRCAVVCA